MSVEVKGSMGFKKGDKVMFLGILDKASCYTYPVKEDSLIPMKIYIVKQIKPVLNVIELEGKLYWHPSRFFQKVEEEL